MRWCWPFMTVVVCYAMSWCSLACASNNTSTCCVSSNWPYNWQIPSHKTQWSRCWKTCFYATPMAHLNSERTYCNSWMIKRCAHYASPRGSYTTWSITTRTGCLTGLRFSPHGLAIELLHLSKQSHHFAVLSHWKLVTRHNTQKEDHHNLSRRGGRMGTRVMLPSGALLLVLVGGTFDKHYPYRSPVLRPHRTHRRPAFSSRP